MLSLRLRQTQQGHKTCGWGNHDTAGRKGGREEVGEEEERRVRKQVCDKESTSGGEERQELGDKRGRVSDGKEDRGLR